MAYEALGFFVAPHETDAFVVAVIVRVRVEDEVAESVVGKVFVEVMCDSFLVSWFRGIFRLRSRVRLLYTPGCRFDCWPTCSRALRIGGSYPKGMVGRLFGCIVVQCAAGVIWCAE